MYTYLILLFFLPLIYTQDLYATWIKIIPNSIVPSPRCDGAVANLNNGLAILQGINI
jgi:hypothetical protein